MVNVTDSHPIGLASLHIHEVLSVIESVGERFAEDRLYI